MYRTGWRGTIDHMESEVRLERSACRLFVRSATVSICKHERVHSFQAEQKWSFSSSLAVAPHWFGQHSNNNPLTVRRASRLFETGSPILAIEACLQW